MWPGLEMSVEGWLRFISHPGSSARMVSNPKYLLYEDVFEFHLSPQLRSLSYPCQCITAEKKFIFVVF